MTSTGRWRASACVRVGRRARQSTKGRYESSAERLYEGREVARNRSAGKQRKERCEVTAIEDTVKRCARRVPCLHRSAGSDATLAAPSPFRRSSCPSPCAHGVQRTASGEQHRSNSLPDELAADAEARSAHTLLERVRGSRSSSSSVASSRSGELKTQMWHLTKRDEQAELSGALKR